MAVAAGEAQVTIKKKIAIGDGRAIYVGTIAFGNKYVTNGDTLAMAANSRVSLPEKIDYLNIGYSGGYGFEWVPGGLLVKAYVSPAAEHLPGVQVANGVDISAVTAAQFMAIGLA